MEKLAFPNSGHWCHGQFKLATTFCCRIQPVLVFNKVSNTHLPHFRRLLTDAMQCFCSGHPELFYFYYENIYTSLWYIWFWKQSRWCKADCVAMYGQCGGKLYNGATCCKSGSVCVAQTNSETGLVNEYYSQCLPSGATPPATSLYYPPGAKSCDPCCFCHCLVFSPKHYLTPILCFYFHSQVFMGSKHPNKMLFNIEQTYAQQGPCVDKIQAVVTPLSDEALDIVRRL